MVMAFNGDGCAGEELERLPADSVFRHVDKTMCSEDLEGQQYAGQKLLDLLQPIVARRDHTGTAMHGKLARAAIGSQGRERTDFDTVLKLNDQVRYPVFILLPIRLFAVSGCQL